MAAEFRYPGEFERQQAVMLCWVTDRYSAKGYDAQQVFIDIVKALLDEVQVYVNCGVEGSLESCKEAFRQNGVDPEKIVFTQFTDLLNWARDYGPDILVDGCGNMRSVKMNFNGYGMETPADFLSTSAKYTGAHQSITLGCLDMVSTDLISEGGDKEFNGAGVLMTIEDTEVRKRNPQYTKEQVEAEYKRLFNLKKVIWLPAPTFEDEDIFDGPLDIVDGAPVYRSLSANGHIDEMCRFVDKNTVLLAEVTDEEAQELESARITKERLDAAYEVLKHETDADGVPLKIVRIPVPEPYYLTAFAGDAIYETWEMTKGGAGISDTLRDGTPYPANGQLRLAAAASYCNFLICNGVVLGQRYWREGLPEKMKEKDAQVKKILEECFPDRKVIMLDTAALNVLGGGVHCVTKNIASAY